MAAGEKRDIFMKAVWLSFADPRVESIMCSRAGGFEGFAPLFKSLTSLFWM
jgi:hypothetical protein